MRRVDWMGDICGDWVGDGVGDRDGGGKVGLGMVSGVVCMVCMVCSV